MEIIAADIGGTHANFSIASVSNSHPEILFSGTFDSASCARFPDLINTFLAEAGSKGLTPEAGCFAVAGPVVNQRVRMTNARFVVDAKEIQKNTSLRDVLIINDFEAVAYATNALNRRDHKTLNKGKPQEGVRAAIGAGTGLGKSILHFNGKFYKPLPSEGGHSDLPLQSRDELDLAEFIIKEKRANQIRYEDVLSGPGLEILYKYLRSRKFPSSPPGRTANDISLSRKSDPCSREAFAWFVRFYARCARNFALDTLPRGGLYIAGGIVAKNPDMFSQFMREFVKNDVHSKLLKEIPVFLITNYQISLVGAAYAFTHNSVL